MYCIRGNPTESRSEQAFRNGEFWQREYLDRFVRNGEHYECVIAYIEENPVKAGLAKLKTERLEQRGFAPECRLGGKLI